MYFPHGEVHKGMERYKKENLQSKVTPEAIINIKMRFIIISLSSYLYFSFLN